MSQREAVLQSKGYEITPLPPASAKFLERVVVNGNTAYVSGHTAGKGKVPSAVTVEQGYQFASNACAACLRSVREKLGSLDRVERVLRVTGYVNADIDFTDCSQVIHGASDLLLEVFGDQGKHARTAVGMMQLPGGTAVEIEMILQVKS